MNRHQPHPITRDELPEVISRYLRAHQAHDTAAAVATFARDATVIDEGNTYCGTSAIERWLDRSASEYSYTVELTAAERTGADHYTATHHLEGNFPGGVVDLRYQFTVRDGLIERLTIDS